MACKNLLLSTIHFVDGLPSEMVLIYNYLIKHVGRSLQCHILTEIKTERSKVFEILALSSKVFDREQKLELLKDPE